jgi:hypothetical protein
MFSAISAHAGACRHALVLALDVSGSVNEDEYALQTEGVAAALLAPEVQALLLEQPDAPVSLAVFEWSSDKHQDLIQNWVEITSSDILQLVATRVRKHYKDRATLKTAIGSALRFSHALLGQKQECWQRTIDVSSDGANNDGSPPLEVYKTHDFDGITVNALVITLDDQAEKQNAVISKRKDLQAYFKSRVIHGPAAFTMTAVGYRDYQHSLTQKLLKELSPPALSNNSFIQKIPQRPL